MFFHDFFTIFGHKWVTMVAHGVIIWGQECKEHYGWYVMITGHHSLAQKTILCYVLLGLFIFNVFVDFYERVSEWVIEQVIERVIEQVIERVVEWVIEWVSEFWMSFESLMLLLCICINLWGSWQNKNRIGNWKETILYCDYMGS